MLMSSLYQLSEYVSKNFVEGQPDMLGISGTKGATVEIDVLYPWETGDFVKEDSE